MQKKIEMQTVNDAMLMEKSASILQKSRGAEQLNGETRVESCDCVSHNIRKVRPSMLMLACSAQRAPCRFGALSLCVCFLDLHLFFFFYHYNWFYVLHFFCLHQGPVFLQSIF